MTDDTLSRLRALHEAATPPGRGPATAFAFVTREDAALLAVLRTALPALLAVAEAAEAVRSYLDGEEDCDGTEEERFQVPLRAALDALRKVTL